MAGVAWDDFVEELDELLDDSKYKWAWPTISGIKDTVTRTKTVTEGQERAIRNIKRSVSEDQEDRGPQWKRRYEGR